jgi:hypothetical protein
MGNAPVVCLLSPPASLEGSALASQPLVLSLQRPIVHTRSGAGGTDSPRIVRAEMHRSEIEADRGWQAKTGVYIRLRCERTILRFRGRKSHRWGLRAVRAMGTTVRGAGTAIDRLVGEDPRWGDNKQLCPPYSVRAYVTGVTAGSCNVLGGGYLCERGRSCEWCRRRLGNAGPRRSPILEDQRQSGENSSLRVVFPVQRASDATRRAGSSWLARCRAPVFRDGVALRAISLFPGLHRSRDGKMARGEPWRENCIRST